LLTQQLILWISQGWYMNGVATVVCGDADKALLSGALHIFSME